MQHLLSTERGVALAAAFSSRGRRMSYSRIKHTAGGGGHRMLCSEDHFFCETKRRPLVHQGNPRTFRSENTTDFFLPKIFESGCAKELCQIGLAKYETAIKGGLVPGGLEGNAGRQAVYFAFVNSMDKDLDKRFVACKRLKPHHDAIYVVERNRRTFQNLNGWVICFNTIPKGSHQESHPHQRQSREERESQHRGKRQRAHFCKGYRKRDFA